MKARTRLIEFFIDLADACIEKNNFASAMGILSGLSDSSLLRMKETFKEIDKSHAEKLQKVESALDLSNNYKNYFAKLRELSAKEGNVYIPMMAPLLAQYDKSETIPKILEDGTYSTHAIETVSKIIGEMHKAQQKIGLFAEAQGENYFETEHDILGELNFDSPEKAKGILEKVSKERGDAFNQPKQELEAKIDSKVKLDKILYDLSLIIEPRKSE
jgi:hypothetical protein